MLLGVLLLVGAVGVFGQSLQDTLALTEMQIWQLRQEKPAAVAPGGRAAAGRRPGDFAAMRPYEELLDEALHNPILDASQQAKLAEIAKVLDRWNMASEAMVAGLINVQQWPGGISCIVPHPSEFGLSDSQRKELEQIHAPLKAAIAEKDAERLKLRLISGLRSDSAEIAQVDAEISELRAKWSSEPLRSLSRAVLNDAQMAKLAAFEVDLKLVREAIELKLIPDPPKGEPLCM